MALTAVQPAVTSLPLAVRCPDGRLLTLHRAWPQSDDHLLLEFHDAGGAAMAGQWFADPARCGAVAAATGPPAFAVDGAGVVVQPSGTDSRLPFLAELVGRKDAALLSHRPERRAVVRLSGQGATYVKVVRRGRAQAVAAAAERAAMLAGDALRVARPLQYDERLSTVEFAELAGLTALELGRSATAGRLRTVWSSVGTAVRHLHAGETAGLQAHDAAEEATVTRRWVGLATAYGLLDAVDVEARLQALTDDEPGPTGLLHRDLHDKQLLIAPDDGRAGIIDVDTLAVGESALDIANLLVHLELRGRQGLLSADGVRAAGAALLEALQPDPDTVRRIPAYAAATRLRLAAVYAFRPQWAVVARDLLAASLRP